MTFALTAALAAGCGTKPTTDPPDLLLLTVDTLRGDRWGCLGDPAARTPHLDRTARGGTLAFEGRAPAPITLPSHTSMMTGLAPVAHGVRDNGIFRLPEDAGTTLAQAVRDAGWTTAAFVSAYPLSASFGLDRGFDRYDSTLGEDEEDHGAMRQRTAEETVDRVVRWLDGGRGDPPAAERPLFLWVHFFDPHAEYTPPAPWRTLFAGDPYRGEVCAVDAATGRLLHVLAARRGTRELFVVVVADHGEGLGEHGESTHGALVHASTLRVPILVRDAGFAPRLLAEPLAVERGAATLLRRAALGDALNPGSAPPLDAPPTPVIGETLYPHYNFGWSGLRVLESDGWRLVSGPVNRLYRPAEDPGETRDLASTHPDVVATLRAHLDREWAARREHAFGSTRRELTDRDAEALRALGYVAGAAGGEDDAEAAFLSGDDPHARLPLVDRINEALTWLQQDAPQRSLDLLRRVVAEDPENRFAWQYLGQAALDAGRAEEARTAFRRALALGPNPDAVYRDLARAEAALGNATAERDVLAEALAANPRSAETRHRLAGVLLREGRPEEAAELLREAVRIRPRFARAWANLAALAQEDGRSDEARDSWSRVLALEGEGPLADLARKQLAQLGGGETR
ncbi:MAG: sulfatase-like hydrolase/transferase [Candidatus Eiseniibacteriota bacterium]